MTVTHTQLRARFASRLSALYGQEVPAYKTLVEVTESINVEAIERVGADAEKLGSIDRVTAERHGAIRVGNEREMSQVAAIFGAMGMFPVGFYDLREAASSSIPVVSTAFRPIDAEELAANPFRVFTSMLVASDRRFFDNDLGGRLASFLDSRTLFPDELLVLAAESEAKLGLDDAAAERFLTLATNAFALSEEPVDRAWYRELESVSAVAADIGGVTTTHINHLTPRVLDIDLLHTRMEQRGISMIDTIQGPPRTDGTDLLLRQTSFRALDEERRFRESDGSIRTGTLRVRFGEVESRGVAATPAGRDRYDAFLARLDSMSATERADGGARELWSAMVPESDIELLDKDLAYFTVRATGREADRGASIADLVRSGSVVAEPIVYEDFLPKSAAGIFTSNLDSEGSRDSGRDATAFDALSMEGVLGRTLHDPHTLYSRIREASIEEVRRVLRLDPESDPAVSV
ncbi:MULTISPECIES: 2-oxoadipate dioxygenase/decarboxylase [Nocardiaceae]|uniref:2-oxoadipate dioxygenase/decarboxylase n=1 Tax=Rhodococcoides kroppenstedtii TaxID=293050 RepID=A0ABS7NS69_9NOCA|nr:MULTISPECIES: VOC family protein [Rhodococcus]AMY18438.1 hypothetical protein A3Q40_01042 [Rhodococcus sp. PBTS 1]MBY6312398.1 VOC family protein [Rhodococcus kroppenstedtii]MBY6320290.1 VOC family protein [Rhodococcus kroppenstedtii]MBY6398689.1 VOC family protein [Rhodococcus kroppenstedtii]